MRTVRHQEKRVTRSMAVTLYAGDLDAGHYGIGC